jgi:hypothetical protein
MGRQQPLPQPERGTRSLSGTYIAAAMNILAVALTPVLFLNFPWHGGAGKVVRPASDLVVNLALGISGLSIVAMVISFVGVAQCQRGEIRLPEWAAWTLAAVAVLTLLGSIAQVLIYGLLWMFVHTGQP